jgi:hypothetical protein
MLVERPFFSACTCIQVVRNASAWVRGIAMQCVPYGKHVAPWRLRARSPFSRSKESEFGAVADHGNRD